MRKHAFFCLLDSAGSPVGSTVAGIECAALKSKYTDAGDQWHGSLLLGKL